MKYKIALLYHDVLFKAYIIDFIIIIYLFFIIIYSIDVLIKGFKILQAFGQILKILFKFLSFHMTF